MFQKLREAALAYHLERKWSKQKILTQYLNSVYFGNGAYGIESAVRTYFGGEDAGGPGGEPAPAEHVASPARGRPAGGDDRLAEHVRPDPEPGQGARARATSSCSTGCSSSG